MTVETIATSLVAALAYSIVFYVKKHKPDSPEEFNPYKMVSTMLVGLGVGAMYVYMGDAVSQQKIETQLVIYAGTTAMVESMLKTAYRRYIQPRL